MAARFEFQMKLEHMLFGINNFFIKRSTSWIKFIYFFIIFSSPEKRKIYSVHGENAT